MCYEEINFMTEKENYSEPVNNSKPVAVFKTRRNAERIKQQTGRWQQCIRRILPICCGITESLQALQKPNVN